MFCDSLTLTSRPLPPHIYLPIKTLHEALVPESKERVHRHLIIQEGPMEANNPLLRLAPNATSILSCQEVSR